MVTPHDEVALSKKNYETGLSWMLFTKFDQERVALIVNWHHPPNFLID
jgi:hypothetical protein